MTGDRILYLARHGELITDEHRRFLGQLDIPLNDHGRTQARALRAFCRRLAIARIYCSDLSRSRETAEIIAHQRAIPVIENVGLREISLGVWEGCAMSEIARQHPLEFKTRGEDLENYRVPGGESFADCRFRVLPVINEILQSTSEDILIVGHAGVNRVVLCDAMGIPLANVFRIGQAYGCLNILERGHAGCRVKLLNFVPREPAIARGKVRPKPKASAVV